MYTKILLSFKSFRNRTATQNQNIETQIIVLQVPIYNTIYYTRNVYNMYVPAVTVLLLLFRVVKTPRRAKIDKRDNNGQGLSQTHCCSCTWNEFRHPTAG